VAEGQADGCRHQRRRIVDAVADHHGRRAFVLRVGNSNLLLCRLSGVDLLDPDPTLPEVHEAYHAGSIRSFARHSRLGYTDLDSPAAVEQAFHDNVAYLRKLGFSLISLKPGSYGVEALAMAMKYATDCDLDLLTIDGSSGGTGMSPWNMMESWGVTSIHLHNKAHEYASILAQNKRVVDLSFAGGLAREDHIFKALALGAPFVKLICMGRAMMIPGFLGSNIEGVLKPENRAHVNGNWDKLAPTVAEIGDAPEEIFAGYYDLQKKIGAAAMRDVPFGAIAIWTFCDKLRAGLQQLMAGARKFALPEISRDDIMAANRETEQELGIPFMTEALDDKAKRILNG